MDEINYDIMRYELDSNGYISNVYFGCASGTCAGYQGTIPSGYDSLEDWAENANIKAYKIVNGNLVYDAQRDAELQAQYEVEAERNANASVGYVNDKINQISSLYDNNLKKTTTDLRIDDASEYSIPEIVIEAKDIDLTELEYKNGGVTISNLTPNSVDVKSDTTSTYTTGRFVLNLPVGEYELNAIATWEDDTYSGGFGALLNVSVYNKGTSTRVSWQEVNWKNDTKGDKKTKTITITDNDLYDYILQFYPVSNVASQGRIVNFSDIHLKQTKFDDGIKLQVSNSNLLTNAGKEETINGLTFVPNEDGTVYVSGTATADVEYIVAGSMENTTPLFMIDTVHSMHTEFDDQWVTVDITMDGSGSGGTLKGRIYSYDGTDRELVAEQWNELTENKYITCATLYFTSGVTIDATLGLTVRKQDDTSSYVQGKSRGVIDIGISELGIDEKIVISGGYVKLVDDEGNEDIIKTILPLMSYAEEEDGYDYTMIQCSEDLKITTTYYSNLKMGGFNITTNGFEIEIKSNYDYTEEDYEKLNNYLLDVETLTDEEMVKYDISGDGKVLSNDSLLMRYMLDYGITTYQGVKFKINNGEMANMFEFLTIKDGNDNTLTKLGLRGITTNGLTVNGNTTAQNIDAENIETDALSVGDVDILNALFYKKGDTFAPPRAIAVGGYITSSAKAILFSIPVPKSMVKVADSITLNALKLTIRHTNGGYVMNATDVLADSTITPNCYKISDNMIMVNITKSSAYSGATNNTPLAVSVDKISIEFN